MTRIAFEQEALLKKFSLRRVERCDRGIIKGLVCERNKNIECYLKNKGLDDNESGRLAMYMILSPEGELCMVFTLSCGMLFTPEVMDADQSYVFNQYQSGKITEEQAKNEIRGWDDSKWIMSDTLSCKNPGAVYARVQYPALELVHICNNDSARAYWNNLGLPKRMGETMFWFRIVPLICTLNSLVGFDYLYLYAADNKKRKTEDCGKLINYYEHAFAFRQDSNIGIIKPQYNHSCTFMIQAMTDLILNKEVFLSMFNSEEKQFFPRP